MHGAGYSTADHSSYAPPAAGVAGAGAGGIGAAASGHDHVTDAKKKKTFGERFYDWSVKAGVPANKITNKLGSEAFWPTSMDKECDKAARILKSFCSTSLRPSLFLILCQLLTIQQKTDFTPTRPPNLRPPRAMPRIPVPRTTRRPRPWSRSRPKL